jgi:hypothetical protein
VINHAPVFTLASTTADNKDPDEYFIVTAYVTDSDVAHTPDTLRLYVCTTNSIISYAAGCADETLCAEMSTTSPNAVCAFSIPAPAAAGTHNYYAFVYDSHELAAAPASRAGSYTVNDAQPTLGTLLLNGGSDITLNIKGAGDTPVSAVNANVQDLNGCFDLVSAIGAIYMSNAADYGCSENEEDCYQATSSACVISDCASSTDMTATISCTANLKYFAKPTDNYSASNPWKDNVWLSYLRVYDGANYAIATSASVELITNLAISVAEDTIDFGSGLAEGENTGADNASTTVENAGNSPLNTDITGQDLSGQSYSGYIEVEYIKWSTSTFQYELEPDFLKPTSQIVDIIAPRATSSAGEVGDLIYWGIGIPAICTPDRYIGQNNFSAVLDINDW